MLNARRPEALDRSVRSAAADVLGKGGLGRADTRQVYVTDTRTVRAKVGARRRFEESRNAVNGYPSPRSGESKSLRSLRCSSTS